MAAGEFVIKNYYEVLMIDKAQATDPHRLKAAYHRRLRDLNPNKYSEEIQWNRNTLLVAEAYEILSDPEKKALYDQASEHADSKQVQLSAKEMDNNLRFGKADLYLHMPDENSSSGQNIVADKLSLSKENNTLKIITNGRNVEAETFLLTVRPKHDDKSSPVVVGLVTISKEDKNVIVFSFIKDLDAVALKEGFKWPALYASGAMDPSGKYGQAGRKEGSYADDITSYLVTYDAYSLSLAQHEKKYAEDTATNLAGRFNSEKKIAAIHRAVEADSRVLLVDALKQPRKLEFWISTSAQNMPASLREPRPICQSEESVRLQEEPTHPKEESTHNRPKTR